ncbi:putative E3 ubiquitin-protein ligase RNF144A-B-like protein [Leptotrombidium deliense]|uniref:E3 ubiquitin-protein ligase RNF144B n=1 Tax=Leptotrombidium deliense TaxID=299467 RepID=A0A443SQR2_9ACAR|nr:putative E3 ubiquitin-protein ligase RNF144A-B-like protein [Leptotrombidium deliense]
MSCMGKLKTKSNENGSNECMSTQDKGKLIRTSTAINLVNYKTQTLCQLCPLCLTTFPKHEMHTVYSCGCKFCKCCFSQYLTVNIKENNDVNFLNCPDSDCPIARNSDSKRRCKNNLISVQEIEMYVDSATFDLYEKFKVDWEVENDPHRTWCPTPNCDNICVITKPTLTSLTSSSSLSSSTTSTANIDKDKGLQFFCPKCDQTFCSHCRRLWHPGFPCQSASEDDNLTLILLRSNNTSLKSEIKRCPRCSVWIERDEGCAQMMCRKCKHVFCWFCLQSLEDDFLLRHYDKGPCKNKLGHSRASVIWHRTQVIGIFAGFGVLLLLASPLFLLAAPCILCCNCCCTSSCKYIEEVDLDAGVGDLSLSSSSSFDDEFLFQSKRQQNDKHLLIKD